MLQRIGISGRLVKKMRSCRPMSSSDVSESSCSTKAISLSSWHSSSASMTTTSGQAGVSAAAAASAAAASYVSGPSTSCFHWSLSSWSATLPLCAETAAQIFRCSTGDSLDSCTAFVVTNLRADSSSPPPREKKKLPASWPALKHSHATVRAIADLPVPAMPVSQYIRSPPPPPPPLPLLPPAPRPVLPLAHAMISCRTCTRVLGRHSDLVPRL